MNQLPDKLYYTIGEVAKHFGLNTSNLRYWEREFKQLHPKKNASGKRKYSKDDIAVIGAINHLVKDRGFTIEGAKKHLKDEGKSAVAKVEALEKLGYVKSELQKILRTMQAD
jgi:DNA-binding transcriptional MerR regulator